MNHRRSRTDDKRQFSQGTLLENYRYLMSEELIDRCSIDSLDDLSAPRVSLDEFQSQYFELFHWCERISLKLQSTTTFSFHLRRYYEDLYAQGSMRWQIFSHYVQTLIERHSPFHSMVESKRRIIEQMWQQLEEQLKILLDENFDHLIVDEFDEFERWIEQIRRDLLPYKSLRLNSSPSTREQLDQLMILQDQIRSRSSRVSSLIEMSHRLNWEITYATDLEHQWHHLWIESVEIQCHLEEKLQTISDDDDIIPFHASEYEKIPLTSSNNLNPAIPMTNIQRYLSPSTYYYSLTNINDVDLINTRSKFDVGYGSEDDRLLEKSPSDSMIYRKCPKTTTRHFSLTTTTGYSSDVEFDTLTTTASEKTTSSTSEKIDPCWDGYQNPLFYPLNCEEIETMSKWEEEFLEMDSQNIEHSRERRTFNRMNNDSDSDFDDFHHVIKESERQLRSSRHFTHCSEEILRTCQTNIQCLEEIFFNLPRSNNSRFNSNETIGQLQTYLTDWYDMREEVQHHQTRARQILHLSQEIIRLKLKFDQFFARLNHLFDYSALATLLPNKEFLQDQINSDQDNRQKLIHFRTEFQMANEHLRDYLRQSPEEPSTVNLQEFLQTGQEQLDQLTEKMDSYQNQLRTLLNLIDRLLPLETQIEEQIASNSSPDVTLLETYERLIPSSSTNPLMSTLKNHCEEKLNLYRLKDRRHVSFDELINFNNNNSSVISSSSNSSTPQIKEHKNRDTERTTTSFISDDCKVLYIETVIEVAKPIFYERTRETRTTTNQFHHHPFINRPRLSSTQRPLTTMTSQNGQAMPDSSDDDQPRPPSKQTNDSGVDLQTTPSSSTLNNERNTNGSSQLLFPMEFDSRNQRPPSTFLQRLRDKSKNEIPSIDVFVDHPRYVTTRRSRRSRTNHWSWSRLARRCFHALILGLLIMLLIALVHVFRLDNCSRNRLFKDFVQSFISVERQGLPII